MKKSQSIPAHSPSRVKKAFLMVIKYRYLIALILFAALVLFKVNYSSWGIFTQTYFGTNVQTHKLGILRGVRSDEWAVQTPYYIAQSNSGTPFSVVNDNITLSGQNMILSYGAPVWDISALAKPLSWGFLLFGYEYGMAWYWNMKLILMVLLSYELSMIITRGNKAVSFIGAFWITYSPAIQWWFMQHVGDIVFFMEAVVVLFYYCLRYRDRLPLRIIFAALLSFACVGYVLTVYPAIQVPLVYLGLMLCILIVTDFHGKLKFGWKDALTAVCSLAVITLMLAHVYLISKDAFAAVMNTVYPGKRISAGGGGTLAGLNSFLTNIFLPYKDIPAAISNDCEASSFYFFLPAVLLALPLLVKRRAENLKYGVALSVFAVLGAMYYIFKIPETLAKITLLSYVTQRVIIAVGLASVYLSIWALAAITKGNRPGAIYSAVVTVLIGLSYFYTIKTTNISGYVGIQYYIAFILIFVVLNFALLRGYKRLFALLMVPVILISGATVNPINIGNSKFFDNKFAAQVSTIKKSNPGARWISTDHFIGAYLYALGVKDLDGINYYPDMAKWRLLDPDGKYAGVYNRYAHINFEITDGGTEFELNQADDISVKVNGSDLEKLGVKYIVSRDRLDKLTNGGATFSEVGDKPYDGLYIYNVTYK